MVLLIADPGPLRAAIEQDLRTAGHDVAVRTADDQDLWLVARGRKGVVYLPSASLLGGSMTPAPSRDRLREALAAAGAPGVEVVVPVFPDHAAFDVEIDALKRHGGNYVGLRSPPLLEEIATLLPDERRSLWLPRLGQVRAVGLATLLSAVREALATDSQGRVTTLAGDQYDAASLVRAAAMATGRRLAVRALGPWVFRRLRGLWRWLRRREVDLMAALAPLLPEAQGRRPLAALPPSRA